MEAAKRLARLQIVSSPRASERHRCKSRWLLLGLPAVPLGSQSVSASSTPPPSSRSASRPRSASPSETALVGSGLRGLSAELSQWPIQVSLLPLGTLQRLLESIDALPAEVVVGHRQQRLGRAVGVGHLVPGADASQVHVRHERQHEGVVGERERHLSLVIRRPRRDPEEHVRQDVHLDGVGGRLLRPAMIPTDERSVCSVPSGV